jgi:hypothetical protein
MENEFFPPNYWLVLSAQAFLLPATLAYRSTVYPTAIIYLCLWLTSSYYHSTYSPISFYIDQVAVWIAVARSFVDGYNTYPYGLLCTFAANGYNYYVFVHAKYCSSSDLRISTTAHAGIHVFTSIAVAIQMFLSNHRITDIDHRTLRPQV